MTGAKKSSLRKSIARMLGYGGSMTRAQKKQIRKIIRNGQTLLHSITADDARALFAMTPPSDHDAFLRAIIEKPDDDLHRLIYADFLDERGEAERAEFIRVQCALAVHQREVEKYIERQHLPPEMRVSSFHITPDLDALRRRERELLDSMAPESVGQLFSNFRWWLPEPLPFRSMEGYERDRWITFRRGFVEEITCSWADWRTHADAIRAATPLRKVRLTTWDGGYVLAVDNGDQRYFKLPEYPGIEFELPQPRRQPVTPNAIETTVLHLGVHDWLRAGRNVVHSQVMTTFDPSQRAYAVHLDKSVRIHGEVRHFTGSVGFAHIETVTARSARGLVDLIAGRMRDAVEQINRLIETESRVEPVTDQDRAISGYGFAGMR